MSNRKKIMHPLAHLDGLTIPGSCCKTELRINRRHPDMHMAGFAHDDWCDHTNPLRQFQSVQAAVAELGRRGIRAVQVMSTSGECGLWLLGYSEASS